MRTIHVLLFIVMVVLGGCASTEDYSQMQMTPETKGKAIVVAGIRVYPTRIGLYLSISHWPADRNAASGFAVFREIGNFPTDSTEIRYMMSEVVPGEYVITSYNISSYNGRSDYYCSRITKKYKVNEGEVVYIGDYTFDVGLFGGRGPDMKFTSDLKAAETAVRLIPGITSEVKAAVFQPARADYDSVDARGFPKGLCRPVG